MILAILIRGVPALRCRQSYTRSSRSSCLYCLPIATLSNNGFARHLKCLGPLVRRQIFSETTTDYANWMAVAGGNRWVIMGGGVSFARVRINRVAPTAGGHGRGCHDVYGIYCHGRGPKHARRGLIPRIDKGSFGCRIFTLNDGSRKAWISG